MSATNYVSNTTAPAQQYETLPPDGSQVTQPPNPGDEQSQPAPSWSLAPSYLSPYKMPSILPDLRGVPGSACSPDSQPYNLLPPFNSAHSFVTDTILFPRQPEPSNAFIRSLITTQVWQDNVLRRHSQN